MEIKIRDLKLTDLDDLYYWYSSDKEFQKFDGPYFAKETKEELREYIESIKQKLAKGSKNPYGSKKIIANQDTDEVIGSVTCYWKSKETLWLEVGIVIFDENYWGRGIGMAALKIWINEVFNSHPEIVRVGLTTWSGNKRMMALAEKLGLQKEAVYRKARIVDGKYYDSVSYGVLREEWEQNISNKV